MTQIESLQTIESYLRVMQVNASDVSFTNSEAFANGRDIFTFDYDNKYFTLLTVDGDFICKLHLEYMEELFHSIIDYTRCDDCNDNKMRLAYHTNDPNEEGYLISCECSNVIFK